MYLVQGAIPLASMLRNSQCNISILVLNNCKLDLYGVLQIVQALCGNSSMKELDLAGNIDVSGREALQCETTLEEKTDSSPDAKNTESHQIQSELSPIDHGDGQLEVADSEDERMGPEPCPSGMSRSCAGSSRVVRLPDRQLIEELSAAIGSARQLELLDLSSNGFSSSDVELFYASWANSRTVHPALKHVNGELLHLSVGGRRCCRVKPCCKF
ncbi:hypothetical protein SAY86_009570 [Trapa natans]|uniref:Uncharacterized protein n=1 Tax=Trapa natans TaxID=22666 RepID=A0AAN7QT52_TRANT|nr:hypothetical protein SAY86_009570 [Trapa natans]